MSSTDETKDDAGAREPTAAELARASQIIEVFAPVRFELLGGAEAQLRVMHDRITSGAAPVEHLKNPRGRDWLAALNEQIFGTFREGLVAVHYHLVRIRDIEGTIRMLAQDHQNLFTSAGTLGLFCRPLNVEYQAFTFAVRRTLEYLAGATAMYFKTDCNRIRRLSHAIEGRSPEAACSAVRERLAAADLERVIGTGDSKSTRDVLAHYESIAAGTVNIRQAPDGELLVYLVGGGEAMPGSLHDAEIEDLSLVLGKRVEWLEDLSFGIFRDLGLLAD